MPSTTEGPNGPVENFGPMFPSEADLELAFPNWNLIPSAESILHPPTKSGTPAKTKKGRTPKPKKPKATSHTSRHSGAASHRTTGTGSTSRATSTSKSAKHPTGRLIFSSNPGPVTVAVPGDLRSGHMPTLPKGAP